MYIKLSTLGFGILGILGCAALVYLIICLHKISQLLTKVNSFWDLNNNNLSKVVSDLPKATNNIIELTDNLNVVSQVVTQTAASTIEAKENISQYISMAKDIISIVKKVFGYK